MWRTVIASTLSVLLGLGAASWLTHDFQVWTDEGARRLGVALHPVEVPPVMIESFNLDAIPLPALLRQQDTVTIATFIYTRCQAICLSLGSIFQQMQAELLNDKNNGRMTHVRLLSISFDHERDDSMALQAYADNLGAKPDFWYFIRIPQAEQQHALLQRLGVVVIPNDQGDYEHNAALLVFNAGGRMVRIFDIEAHQQALDYARHLARKQIQEESS